MHRLALILVALASSVAHAKVDEPLYACRVPPAGTKLTASFQPETSLKDLATWVTGFTCKNIVFSADVPKHATKVTIISPNKMTPKQALALFVDAVEATGLTVQIKTDTIIIKLGPKMPKNCPDTTATAGDTTPDSLAEADLHSAIDKGIRKIDSTHFEISAAAIDAILANPMGVARGFRVVPGIKDGKPDSMKLYAVRPSSVAAKLGMSNGDAIRSINGVPLDSADKALEIYSTLRTAKSFDIQLTRRGKPVTISIKVTP